MLRESIFKMKSMSNGHSSTEKLDMVENEINLNLVFHDEVHHGNLLEGLNKMRKNRQFCDVILHVGNIEIHAHRAVLASASPYLFDLFTNDQEQKLPVENIITYKLNGGFDKHALQLLVEYAYTSKLDVPYQKVKAVYQAATHLKIERVARLCTEHLIKHLSPDNCIEIRNLPGIAKNEEFCKRVDEYIAKEYETISKSPALLNLFCARIEVLNQSRQEMSLVDQNSVCRLVLDWIKRQMNEESLSLDALSEKTHMLYIAIDNSLQDCSGLPSGDISDTEIVQDYKKMSSKTGKPNSKNKRKFLGQPTKPRVLIHSREIGEEPEVEREPDWSLIATSKLADHSFLALVTLAGQLASLSIQLRLNTPTTPSPITTPDVSRSTSEEKPDLYCAIANMSCARCSMGCGNLNNTLLVCGGYDRVECLKTVEQYIPEINKWKELPSMKYPRGRVQIAVLSNKVYAIGGSNGTTELDSVEMLDVNAEKWVSLPKLPLARSNMGVCDLNGLIYCVGGWNGQVGIKQCDTFDPETCTWSTIASLNTGRYQAGVTAFNGLVYAIGGSDAWNCLNTVEVYNPTDNVWTFSKHIITARRGCGVAVFNNKLYVIGGSDGTQSLNSTEVFDEETQSWMVGPSMTTPRSNVEVAVVGDRLYAVGGFSGKSFLNTIEYLDSNSNEWTTFVPKITSEPYKRHRRSSRKSVSDEAKTSELKSPQKSALEEQESKKENRACNL
ncbi:influenza virus NS1A-binding protein isoform X3 [Agrilus planipennis]|uniref:Influenza virus NS1A-binding protein isoform X3 n=1 Tax=Agrilus planipennis TaxID=224129 RepID=A0A7F5RI52_AGRPL|nr:influenza virus NS1A-binding protein isoform X3 [Agrilus planipennis]